MSTATSLGGGHVTDIRTARMLDEVEKLAGVTLQYAQGSYTGTVSASGSTHDKGGAVDIRTIPLGTRARKLKVLAALRRVGFAAWIRPYVPGLWGEHIHAIAIQPGGKYDQGVLSGGARRQVTAYYDGRDGLAGNRVDPHADLKIKPRTWEQYKRWRDKPVVSFAAMKKNKRHTRAVQRAMNKLFKLGLVEDGVWGPQTQRGWEWTIRRTKLRGLPLATYLGKQSGYFRATK